jgi:hypothetical protein
LKKVEKAIIFTKSKKWIFEDNLKRLLKNAKQMINLICDVA